MYKLPARVFPTWSPVVVYQWTFGTSVERKIRPWGPTAPGWGDSVGSDNLRVERRPACQVEVSDTVGVVFGSCSSVHVSRGFYTAGGPREREKSGVGKSCTTEFTNTDGSRLDPSFLCYLTRLHQGPYTRENPFTERPPTVFVRGWVFIYW